VLGGGFVNTELRELAEPRLFDFVDYVTLDSGERPLLALVEHLPARPRAPGAHLRARRRRRGDGAAHRLARARRALRRGGHAHLGRPAAGPLPVLLDMLNPMNRLWSDGRWNKLTVAQGCYWKKCSFCDVGLDYIGRYETTTAQMLVDRMEAIVAETGQTGFTSWTRPRRPRCCAPWPRSCCAASCR
jgi:radical SAM superfamily enzyme YgiQ (UPF0313 family)